MIARRALLVPALLAATALAGIGCGGGPSQAQCEKLRAHLVDLEAAAGGAGAEQKADLAAQKKKVIEAIDLRFCLEDLTVQQVECGLKARSLEELSTSCDRS